MITLSKENFERLISIHIDSASLTTKLIDLYNELFGKYNTKLIIEYINGSRRMFDNLDELFDYLSDPHIKLVTDCNALTVNELCKKFQNNIMFLDFKKAINDYERGIY